MSRQAWDQQLPAEVAEAVEDLAQLVCIHCHKQPPTGITELFPLSKLESLGRLF